MSEQAERKDLEAAARALGLSPDEVRSESESPNPLVEGEAAQGAAAGRPSGDETDGGATGAGHPSGPEAAEGSTVAGGEVAQGREQEEEDDKSWYVVHTYSGYERKVKQSLEERVRTMGLEQDIAEILIPTEDVVELKGGKKVVTSKKFFPGYLLVRMRMTDSLWHLVKNTPRVTGFVGEGRNAIPLRPEEVNKILNRMEESVEAPKPKFQFRKGETVRITDGPFTNFTGKVEEVDNRRNTLKVMVSIFGRPTPVELDFFQVEKT